MNNKTATNPWRIWGTVALLMFVIQAATSSVLPSLMQDEAQITDYGRLALDPLSRWSVTWWVAGDKPLLLWSYLGPVIAELGFQFGGEAGVGPRIMGLLGGLLASVMAFGWLLSRKVPANVAGLLAIAFLLDPLFTLSQRMARSDSWVMAFCLSTCWMIVLSASKTQFIKLVLVALAGVTTAIAFFVWPSAVFLYPLIGVEFFRCHYKGDSNKLALKPVLLSAGVFLVGVLLASIILILPIWSQLSTILDGMRDIVALNVNSNKTPVERILGLSNIELWVKLIKAFVKTLSPGIPVLAFFAIIYIRPKLLLAATISTLLAILLTLVYEFRVMYLLPYCLALVGEFFSLSENKTPNPKRYRAGLTLLVLTVAWSFGISILLRTGIAINDRKSLDRDILSQTANKAIGAGKYKVFLAFAYEFYFVGRSLGWQLYTPYIHFSYDDDGNWIRNNDYQPKKRFMELMSEMDYAIFPGREIDPELREQLASSGLLHQDTLWLGKQHQNITKIGDSDETADVFIWYLRGAPSYGPYLLFSRERH